MNSTRNQALDAYRGLVMLLMMAEVLRLSSLARAHPDSAVLQFLAWNQTHVAWEGCSLHDLIQPSFSFLVGAALPWSIASRIARGGTFRRMFAHALWRSLVLCALGIFLRSTHATQTNFTFEDTLTQIGLGYPFLFVLGFASQRTRWLAFGGILFAYWVAWMTYPAPGWVWAKNANLASDFDLWFLNLFPRAKPFTGNGGGYVTLSFIPTLGTMIFGLIAGTRVREEGVPARWLALTGVGAAAAGVALHLTGLCPIVKRIWTPAWTLFSGGLCCLLLLGFLMALREPRRWAFPLVVIGTNSIAAYLIAHLWDEFLFNSLRIHFWLEAGFFAGLLVLSMYWLILWWLYRRKLFLKI